MRSKIIQGRNYGSIPHLSTSKLGKHDKFIHEGQERIIRNGGRDKHDVVIVSLKLDGTNVGVVKKGGQIITLQRKGYDCASSPYRQHHEFNNWVHANYERFDVLLHEGDRIVGEWMWQASGLKYEIKGDPFFAFDYFPYYNEGKKRMSYAAFKEYLDYRGDWIQSVPYFQYAEMGLSESDDLAAEFSLAVPIEEKHEGFVIRVERKGEFDFAAKWVHPDYVPGKYLPGLNDNSPKVITLNRFV